MKYFLFAICLFAACSVVKHRSFVAKPSNRGDGNILHSGLKLSGSYYNIHMNKGYEGENCLQYFIFYENNIATDGAICGKEYVFNNKESIKYHINDNFQLSIKNWGNEFGGYIIKNDSIIIQFMRYVPQFKWAPITFRGIIINDTTIRISRIEMKERDWIRNSVFDLHYIPMEKPDSLLYNRWKNKKWYFNKND